MYTVDCCNTCVIHSYHTTGDVIILFIIFYLTYLDLMVFDVFIVLIVKSV